MKREIAAHESEVPQMKRIGIIGGFGQWATLDVIERICRYTADHLPQYGNRGYPPMDVRFMNKAPMLLNSDGSYPGELTPSPEFLEAAKYVGESADFLILPSNTPHFFQTEIEHASGKKLLSMVDVTVEEANRSKCKRVGILAIGLTLEKRLFQDPLEKVGIESVIISNEFSDRLDDEGVYPVQQGVPVSEIGTPNIAHEAVDYLRSQQVDGIILGCSELPLLLGSETDARDILNPSQLLAEAAVKKALQV